MRSLVAATGAAALAVALVSVAPTASAATDDGSHSSTALEFIAQHPQAVHASGGDSYRLQRTIAGPSGETHLRYTRSYHGLPVIGGDFVVHEGSAGHVLGISTAQEQAVPATAKPTTTAAAARAAARSAFTGQRALGTSPAYLAIDARAGTPRLIWATLVQGMAIDGQTPSQLLTLVDASTGVVTDSIEQVSTLAKITTTATRPSLTSGAQDQSKAGQLDAGTGDGIFVGQVPVDTTFDGSAYDMTDPSHGGNNTCDMGNGSSGCSLFTDADNAWGDGANDDRASAGVDAHYGAALTFDYYANTFGRSGIFGDGQGVPSRVHYGNNYVNAFWDGSSMTYGDGSGNQNPLVELDVAGHEMSHGVSEALAGLGYSGDVGGINEANSDIFGTVIEFMANNANDAPDYDIGELININGDGSPLRYMYNPALDGASFNCWNSQVPQSDPHYSSGVGNHWFFLLAEGSGATSYGDSPTCDGSNLTGIGQADAAAIWYHALDAYFLSDETYSEARADTLQSAAELFGSGSAQYGAVAAAWSAVSVS